MKNLLLFFLCFSFGWMLQAQTSKTVDVTAGNLHALLTETERSSITNLTLKGTIDARDFKTIRDQMPGLSVLNLKMVSIAAYEGNEGTSLEGSTTYAVNKIPEYAFYDNNSGKPLIAITLPLDIISIGKYAFKCCYGLSNIWIPSKVQEIEQEAFSNCSHVNYLTLPFSILSIGNSAFANCTSLSTITVGSRTPPDLSNSSNVFYGIRYNCILKVPYGARLNYIDNVDWDFMTIVESDLGFVVNTDSVEIEGTEESQATFMISSTVEWTASSEQDWLVVNPTTGNGLSQVVTLTAKANPSFTSTRRATINVSRNGYQNQTVTVTQSFHPLPSKTIEVTAGGLIAALTAEELDYMNDLTITGTIDARDFKTMRDHMPLLSSLDLSAVTILAYNGTEGTSAIENINYPAHSIPEYAFVSHASDLQGKSSLTSIVLPETLTSIGQYSFTNCAALQEIIIPEMVTEIGSYAFQGCTEIKNITIPSSVTTIGFQAFGIFNGTIQVDADNSNYMSSLGILFNKSQTELIKYPRNKTGSYEIPSTVTKIDDYAFYNCDQLSILIIPSSVTSIGESAFAYCSKLNSIYARSITPVDLSASLSVFNQSNNENCTLYVPFGSKEAYQTAYQWMDFWNIRETYMDLIANAGLNQSIGEGTLVTLEGLVIANTSGMPLTYQWTAPAEITLSSETELNPTFTAPEVDYDTEYNFSLTVSNGLDYSVTDQVVIKVLNIRKPPVANAGIDQTVNEFSLVNLDGSASFDPEGNALTYLWIVPQPIVLSSKYISKPTFTTHSLSKDYSLTFILQVNNGYLTQTDTVVITVKHVNHVPVANAGNVHMVSEGDIVTLDATLSTDADGDALTYKWTAPEGITLSSTTSATPSFTAPTVESDTWLTFKLVVNDGKVNSPPSQVNVFVGNIQSILKLRARVNDLVTSKPVNYKLFMYDGYSFIQKIDTFAVNGDTLTINIEPGYWIALVAPSLDPSAFIPTYSGDVLNWNEAEVFDIPVKGVAYMDINCRRVQAANTGVGKISGFVYEKALGETKSVSISRETNVLFDNPPVPNALVQLYKKGQALPVASVFTDELGAYQFEKLEIADYELMVELPGFVQSEKFPIVLSTAVSATKVWFAVNTASKVITDKNEIQTATIKVYPNPTWGEIHIDGLESKLKNKISLYAIDGSKIWEETTTSSKETIDIGAQVAGTYLLIIDKQRFKIIKK